MTAIEPLWPAMSDEYRESLRDLVDRSPEEWRKFYLQEWPTVPDEHHLDSDRVGMVWRTHPDMPTKYIVLDGHNGEALVRVQPLPAGFLWQYRRRGGHAISIAEAKAMVEGLADHFALPPAQRWMTL